MTKTFTFLPFSILVYLVPSLGDLLNFLKRKRRQGQPVGKVKNLLGPFASHIDITTVFSTLIPQTWEFYKRTYILLGNLP